MTHRTRRGLSGPARACGAQVLAMLLAAGLAHPSCEPEGVVVERVRPGSPAASAGMLPEDVLVSWTLAPSPPASPDGAEGCFTSPADLARVMLELAPRGSMVVHGKRGAETRTFNLAPGVWHVTVRPGLEGEDLAVFTEGRELINAGDVAEGCARFRELSDQWAAHGRLGRAAWLRFHIASSWRQAREVDQAIAVLREAVELARQADDAEAVAQYSFVLAEDLEQASDLAGAAAIYDRIIDTRRHGGVDSLQLANALNNRGRLRHIAGQLDQAADLYRSALTIRERLAPEGPEVAASLNNLAIIITLEGDLAAAEPLFRRALAIKERLQPGSSRVASSRLNLGIVLQDRGELVAAEGLYQGALQLWSAYDPEGPGVTAALNQLGMLAIHRRDYRGAEDYIRRALAIHERTAPGSPGLAYFLGNLGDLASAMGDIEAAEGYYARSLAIAEQVAPDSLTVATTIHSLGELAGDRGDNAEARELMGRALSIRRSVAPVSIDTAASLVGLARFEMELGAVEHAEDLAREGHALVEQLVPGTSMEARALHLLATLRRRAGDVEQARLLYERAIDALEAQRRRLGGSEEVKAGFGAAWADLYRDLLELLLEQGDARGAFGVLERSRTRVLLDLLAERDLVFTRDVPEELDRQRRRTDAAYDQRLALLGEAADRDERERLRTGLDEIRRRQHEIRAMIRAASADLAALQYPEPLGLAEVRAALDPGTVMLSYAIGAHSSHLFVLTSGEDELAVFPLDVTETRLRQLVRRFRNAVRLCPDRKRLHDMTRSLAALLLDPARGHLQGAERVLVLPDGPLHLLPFAALTDPCVAHGGFLIERLPVSQAASATVFAQLRARRSTTPWTGFVGFGDPLYAAARVQPTGSALRGGRELRPLPGTRAEVEAVAALYPDSSTLWLGRDATEERVKALGGSLAVVHFACHGLVDEQFPLDSALVLAQPEAGSSDHDNGLLQAWEVFESVRVDVDLVTLSACDTAMGREVTGEGVLGLTRAFQHAGARTVLSSLWPVSDRATAELMRRFYGHLRAGIAKDEALRRAQCELLSTPISGSESGAYEIDASQPAHWAAFQLIGDWR